MSGHVPRDAYSTDLSLPRDLERGVRIQRRTQKSLTKGFAL